MILLCTRNCVNLFQITHSFRITKVTLGTRLAMRIEGHSSLIVVSIERTTSSYTIAAITPHRTDQLSFVSTCKSKRTINTVRCLQATCVKSVLSRSTSRLDCSIWTVVSCGTSLSIRERRSRTVCSSVTVVPSLTVSNLLSSHAEFPTCTESAFLA